MPNAVQSMVRDCDVTPVIERARQCGVPGEQVGRYLMRASAAVAQRWLIVPHPCDEARSVMLLRSGTALLDVSFV